MLEAVFPYLNLGLDTLGEKVRQSAKKKKMSKGMIKDGYVAVADTLDDKKETMFPGALGCDFDSEVTTVDKTASADKN